MQFYEETNDALGLSMIRWQGQYWTWTEMRRPWFMIYVGETDGEGVSNLCWLFFSHFSCLPVPIYFYFYFIFILYYFILFYFTLLVLRVEVRKLHTVTFLNLGVQKPIIIETKRIGPGPYLRGLTGPAPKFFESHKWVKILLRLRLRPGSRCGSLQRFPRPPNWICREGKEGREGRKWLEWRGGEGGKASQRGGRDGGKGNVKSSRNKLLATTLNRPTFK